MIAEYLSSLHCHNESWFVMCSHLHEMSRISKFQNQNIHCKYEIFKSFLTLILTEKMSHHFRVYKSKNVRNSKNNQEAKLKSEEIHWIFLMILMLVADFIFLTLIGRENLESSCFPRYRTFRTCNIMEVSKYIKFQL